MDDLTKLLHLHLKSHNLDAKHTFWRVRQSHLSGRGLFANRDIHPGQIIFVDFPLIVGPRNSPEAHMYCVICSKATQNPCENGCQLPICCNSCKESQLHIRECDFIRRRRKQANSEVFSRTLLKWLAPIRGLFLNNKQSQLLDMLLCEVTQEFEGDLTQINLNLTENEETVIKKVSSLLNSHSFEALADENKTKMSVRAVYPISGLMNHSCVPNTVHVFDPENRMLVKAASLIPKNSEIITTYLPILWGTTTRRHFLSKTKNFWCCCERCADPKEFGAGLNGLKCLECEGILYPINSLNIMSNWQCEKCQTIVSNKKIGRIQTTLGHVLRTMKIENVESLLDFVENKLEKFAPPKSQIAVEFKSKIIWLLGNTDNYKWNELTADLLRLKEDKCKELLDILTELKLGQCRLRGLILMELHRCIIERALRETLVNTSKETDDTQNEQRRILREAAEILQTDTNLNNVLNRFLSN